MEQIIHINKNTTEEERRIICLNYQAQIDIMLEEIALSENYKSFKYANNKSSNLEYSMMPHRFKDVLNKLLSRHKLKYENGKFEYIPSEYERYLESIGDNKKVRFFGTHIREAVYIIKKYIDEIKSSKRN